MNSQHFITWPPYRVIKYCVPTGNTNISRAVFTAHTSYILSDSENCTHQWNIYVNQCAGMSRHMRISEGRGQSTWFMVFWGIINLDLSLIGGASSKKRFPLKICKVINTLTFYYLIGIRWRKREKLVGGCLTSAFRTVPHRFFCFITILGPSRGIWGGGGASDISPPPTFQTEYCSPSEKTIPLLLMLPPTFALFSTWLEYYKWGVLPDITHSFVLKMSTLEVTWISIDSENSKIHSCFSKIMILLLFL